MARPEPRPATGHRSSPHGRYRWVVLSNTTLGVLLATINSSIILISLPAIFRGIHINPLAPGETSVFLWLIMGYMVVTATLLVTIGRISDMVGRVKMYNLGFAVFTLGSVLLAITPGSGNVAAFQLIGYRIVQGIGGAFLFANSAAILTDAFPHDQRGLALGLNQIAAVAGSLVGLILGGVLSAIDYRLVFLVSVPVGVLGTVWAYVALREIAPVERGQRVDVLGNVTFAAGLTILLVGITYGLLPYHGAPMGWSNPLVILALVGGVVLLAVFMAIEARVQDPMFRLDLFRNRAFAAGNLAGLLAAIGRGGLQFMLIIWLQGIWLPLHGYDYQETPLWAGIFMIPMLAGFMIMGPLSGYLSDRYGARGFSTVGMIVSGIAFVLLTLLPANFPYPLFALLILLMGLGMGLFSSPNTASIMNALPPQHRGVGSGMRATFMNSGTLLSMGLFFTMVVLGLSASLPTALFDGLTRNGLPAQAAAEVSHLPPTAALFAAFLGYNPMANLLPPAVLAHLPAASRSVLLGKHFFPTLISPAFMDGLHLAFGLGAALCAVAAVASLLRGGRYVYGVTTERVAEEPSQVAMGGRTPIPASERGYRQHQQPPD
ncbi:MAG TPA: MFS transporter [Candidatus Dormibacteraeota bacterium]|nr:MFS transporter [Candidatus Dormibacteraeota bacterium]